MATKNRPHVVMLAFPIMGHINPMLEFCKVLSARGFYITFVNTEYMHEKMLKSGSIQSTRGITFETIPDGPPPQHGRASNLDEFAESIVTNCPLHFEKLIDKLKSTADVPPLSCIIYNALMSWAQKSAKRLGIPGGYFWTASACGFNIYLSMPLLIEKGYIPLKDKSNLTNGYLEEEEIRCIPGMPTVHVIDVPSFCYDGTKYVFPFLENQCQAALLADFMVMNTFDELEGPIIQTVQPRVPVFSVGPLFLSTAEETNGLSNILTKETSCMKWLDDQSADSVIYVCFGTMAVISEKELVEFAWGLEASNQPFLWAIRPDLVHGASAVLPVDLLNKVKGRGFFVSWAPQIQVLSHPSVGGFLTHSGWNSTLESISAGVPMLSWPFYAEQFINRTFVCQVWKIGIALNADVKRGDVEEKVRRLMKGEEGEEMRRRVGEFREASIKVVKKGGSSYNNLEKISAIIEGKS